MSGLISNVFSIVRGVFAPIVLRVEKLTTSKSVKRSVDQQRKIDASTQHLALYQFKFCLYCVRVRREIKRLSLNIELRDALHNENYRKQLLEGGGQVRVPCLQIRDKNGHINWLYESNDVINYLRQLVAC